MYQITDILGRVISQGILPAEQLILEIPTDILPSGTYLLQITNFKDLSILRKFVKL